jgi:hypothetical protein
MSKVSGMKTDAMAIVGLAASVVMGIAVIGGFKTTGLIDNTTADLFTTGLSIYGTFAGIIVLALVGKLVIGLFNKA